MQTAHALALLPERQAHYDNCCATHARAVAAGAARTVLATQQSVAFALATLNATRADAGLSLLVGPPMRSLDELLALGAGKASPAALLAAAERTTASVWVVASIHQATNAQAA